MWFFTTVEQKKPPKGRNLNTKGRRQQRTDKGGRQTRQKTRRAEGENRREPKRQNRTEESGREEKRDASDGTAKGDERRRGGKERGKANDASQREQKEQRPRRQENQSQKSKKPQQTPPTRTKTTTASPHGATTRQQGYRRSATPQSPAGGRNAPGLRKSGGFPAIMKSPVRRE